MLFPRFAAARMDDRVAALGSDSANLPPAGGEGDGERVPRVKRAA